MSTTQVDDNSVHFPAFIPHTQKKNVKSAEILQGIQTLKFVVFA